MDLSCESGPRVQVSLWSFSTKVAAVNFLPTWDGPTFSKRRFPIL